jgi:hypothetical protein
MIFRVYDVNIPFGINCHLFRRIEYRGPRIAAIAGISPRTGSGHGFDDTVADAPDAASLTFHHVQRSIRRKRHRTCSEHVSLQRWSAVTVMSGVPCSGESFDSVAIQVNDPHPMSCHVGDEKPLLLWVQGQPIRLLQPSPGGRSAIAAEPARSVTGQSRDRAHGIDNTHPSIQAVGEEHPAGAIHHHAIRLVQSRACSRAAVAGKASFARAADGGNDPTDCVDPAQAVVERIRKNQAARQCRPRYLRSIRCWIACCSCGIAPLQTRTMVVGARMSSVGSRIDGQSGGHQDGYECRHGAEKQRGSRSL